MTVTQLNSYVKGVLDDDPFLNYAEIEGEISNFNHYLSSGHMYFTLKDDESAITAVMYRSANAKLTFLPKNGMKVRVRGSVSVYPQTGKYQIYVREMFPDGAGALYMAYEQLKNKLAAEGLFDDSRKKPIPAFPSKIGVITSKFGAAVQDIINISSRRFPAAELLIYPSAVQGKDAPSELCRALSYFERTQSVDVIIIGRGGGSIEDLWAFNDETLARTIAACSLPIISAVGHETDFTICDFVSDLRAPTPSAAAELALPDREELLASLAYTRDCMRRNLKGKILAAQASLDRFSKERIAASLTAKYTSSKKEISMLSSLLTQRIGDKIGRADDNMRSLIALLEARSPLNILSKGYSLVESKSGAAVRSASQIAKSDTVKIRFFDGTAQAQIITVSSEDVITTQIEKEN